MFNMIAFNLTELPMPTPEDAHIRLFDMADNFAKSMETPSMVVLTPSETKGHHKMLTAALPQKMLMDKMPFVRRDMFMGLMEALNKSMKIFTIAVMVKRGSAVDLSKNNVQNLVDKLKGPNYSYLYLENCTGESKHYVFSFDHQWEIKDEFLTIDENFFGENLITNPDSIPDPMGSLKDSLNVNTWRN